MFVLLVVAPADETTRIRDELTTMPMGPDSRFVTTMEAGLDALRMRLWDAVVLAVPGSASDDSAPIDAYLDLAHGSPVIVIAGAIGEEAAAGLIRSGVADVVSQGRIARLPAVLERELRTKSSVMTHRQKSRTAYTWFASIINHIPVGIVYHNEHGEIVLCNEAALTLLGLTEDEFLGRTSLDPRWNIIREDGKPFAGSQHPSSEASRTKRPVRDVTMGVFRPKTNDRVWLNVDAIPELDNEGRLVHVVVKFADVTARKEAEAEGNRLQAQLLQAQKMEALGILAGGVAHDFNNILAAILCSADLLLQELQELRQVSNPGEMPEIVFELQKAAQRGADLVRSILTFSRRANQHRTTIQLEPTIRETIGLLQSICPANVQLCLEQRATPVIFADAIQVHQVLTNICTNAFHAMENTGGTVSVEIDNMTTDRTPSRSVAGLREGHCVRIRVTDNGPGMDAHTLEHLFEPFFTTKQANKGTGLGMAIVHGIVMAHEGAIQVQSTRGRGTTVDVWFPLPLQETIANTGPKSSSPRGSAEHILIIDDEAGLARLFGRMLQGLGYQVTVQTESAKALALFERDPSPFHIALVDLHMPPPGGVATAKRLHELRPGLPIFIMSGYSDALGDTPPEGLGVVGILEKPITRETLAAELRSALDRFAAK